MSFLKNSRASFETKQIHAGHSANSDNGARALPIYQTASYEFGSSEHAASLFDLSLKGHMYTRISNPTQEAVERKIATLEGGTDALLLASGQAAEFYAIANIAESGDHIVASPRLFGGTYNLMTTTLPKFGIDVTLVRDPDDLECWDNSIQPNTKAFFAESISNPMSDVANIPGISSVAHRRGVPLIIDNTVATPYLLRPFEFGADIVVHSATKYLGGHGNSVAGVIVDGGTFDWKESHENFGRFPSFVTPDSGYGAMVYSDSGDAPFTTKARLTLLRDLGAAVSPFNAFLIGMGVETLSLRMQRHVENAVRVAEFLESHGCVSSVNYAGLESSPWFSRARELLPNGAGAVLSFEIRGGLEAGKAFVEALELHSHMANIGDVRSLVIQPASTTHSQLNTTQLASAGITPGLIRLSVGLEGIDDLIDDLTQGLDAARSHVSGEEYFPTAQLQLG